MAEGIDWAKDVSYSSLVECKLTGGLWVVTGIEHGQAVGKRAWGSLMPETSLGDGANWKAWESGLKLKDLREGDRIRRVDTGEICTVKFLCSVGAFVIKPGDLEAHLAGDLNGWVKIE